MSDQHIHPDRPDFIQLVSSLSEIRTDQKHLVRMVEEAKGELRGFVVEHRSQHLEDRTNIREQLDEHRNETKKEVDTRLETRWERQKVWIGIAVMVVVALLGNIVVLLFKGP